MRPWAASPCKPTDAAEPPIGPVTPQASVELHWLPLGAGGWFVKLNGRIWEAIHALWQQRRPRDLYHTALVVRVPEGRLGRWQVFRYEVGCWPDGVIADAGEAVASPQLLTGDPAVARRLLGLVRCLPSPVWGRDELRTGEMWNSNSVIAWLLACSGLPTEQIRPPAGGRAPGWQAGLAVAHRSLNGIDNAAKVLPPAGRTSLVGGGFLGEQQA
jgi:hypothetical protein